MSNIVTVMIIISVFSVFMVLTGFVFLQGEKNRPTPRLVMLSIGMLAFTIVLKFIIN